MQFQPTATGTTKVKSGTNQVIAIPNSIHLPKELEKFTPK